MEAEEETSEEAEEAEEETFEDCFKINTRVLTYQNVFCECVAVRCWHREGFDGGSGEGGG